VRFFREQLQLNSRTVHRQRAKGFPAKSNARSRTENQLGLMNPNLMARADFQPTSAGMHLNIQSRSEFHVFENPTDLNASADFFEARISQRIMAWRKQTMTRFKTLGAAAILSVMMATPVFAQAAVQEPGAFAFYHPDADVLHAGRPRPAETSGAMASVRFGGSNAYASMDSKASASSCAQRYRSYDPASGTFLGYDGNRHSCE
jgi:hypothetical protein